jgi:hypothetical protein
MVATSQVTEGKIKPTFFAVIDHYLKKEELFFRPPGSCHLFTPWNFITSRGFCKSVAPRTRKVRQAIFFENPE